MKQGIGEVINLGSGFEISIGDTVQLITKIMNVSLDIQPDDERTRPASSEVERLCADNNKAKKFLDWSPGYAGPDGFKRGLEKTIEWFSASGTLSRYKPDIYNI